MRAKTVNETQNFERGGDIKYNIGIGMWGQIRELCQKNNAVFNKESLDIFLTCAKEDRIDLMDFLLKNGLDVNGEDSIIPRALAWMGKESLLIYLISNYTVDIDKAISISSAKNEKITLKKLKEIKDIKK